MNKRREMFLAGDSIIKRFTKNTIVENFAVSEEEFEKLIEDGFIQENNRDVCVTCHRIWNHEHEQCLYCGEEEYYKEFGYYCYK